MGKLIKYEFTSTRKFILSTILILLVAIAMLGITIGNINEANGGSITALFVIPVSVFAAVACAIAIAVYIINSFRKELYTDIGYLTFTLPINGFQLTGAKLIVASVWILVTSLTAFAASVIMVSLISKINLIEILNQVLNNSTVLGAVVLSMVGFLEMIVTLLLVYFSIAISRVSLKTKKLGGLWIVVFIVLSVFVSWVGGILYSNAPLLLQLDGFNLINLSDAPYLSGMYGLDLYALSGRAISITTTAYNIIVGIIAFVLTGILLTNKVDVE